MLARRWRPVLGALALWMTFAVGACTQASGAYPRRPVEIVTLDPAGGPTDIVARVLADSAQPSFPQLLVVVNKPGGAGTIAAAQVVRAEPDGYTIGLQAVGPMALQPHRTEQPYGTVDDYRPVINLVRQPLVLAVRRSAVEIAARPAGGRTAEPGGNTGGAARLRDHRRREPRPAGRES